MESLLPSEIARLVLGYLEDQKCEDAARSFLETSLHLQECRAVTSTGRRFSTKVNGFTLADILEKFCAANAIIHERLSKVSDCEQLKHCGDLLEQLRFLVDGSRGQRFVVNINVPTTSQASGGSPIISSSMRKRHHSGSDRDRTKRAHKSHSQTSGKSAEPVSMNCDAVETTPLENLPGHWGSEKVENPIEKSLEKSQEPPAFSNCSSTVPEATGAPTLTETPHESLENIQSSLIPEIVKTSSKNEEKHHERCSTATDTEELMQYTNTEVQTTPYDVAESETDSTYEPVENLSLLTKELLNRTELQERIAENINKAILPSDTSLRDISLTESIGGEMNTSIMTELNNAIKSVVTATESDPMFAKFLDEIIGPDGENDESPDEDGDHQQCGKDGLSCVPPDSIAKDTVPEASVLFEKIATSETTRMPDEVLLKNRLRSSSSQQLIQAEEDRSGISDKLVMKENDGDVAALEDVNAAAILSIINANIKLDEEKSSAEVPSEVLEIEAEKKMMKLEEGKSKVSSIVTVSPVNSVDVEKSMIPTAPTVLINDVKPSRKSNVRKPRAFKPRAKIPEVVPENLISEAEIMAMPTLIVCSQEEMSTIINASPVIEPITGGGYCSSQFLPIAPKTADLLTRPLKPEPIYLRTVTVPTKILEVPREPPFVDLQSVPALKSHQEMPSHNSQTGNEKILPNNLVTVLDHVSTSKLKVPEKITLYGNENSSTVTVLDTSVVTAIHVGEPTSVSGTGLSPFLKFNNGKPKEECALSVPTISIDDEKPRVASTLIQDSYEHITKRTPRSLLKSRSKNNRLSMSTPRRRSSHIRALDFNTPSKSIKIARRMSANESFEYSPKNFGKKICRASLFKSPPFSAETPTPKKSKSPVKDHGPCKVPIATRSPAPKLQGGWEKYTGVGMILGGSTSPSSSSCSPNKTTTSQIIGKSWDEDLRKSLRTCEETTTTMTTITTRVAKKSITRRPQIKRKSRKKIIPSAPNVLSDVASSDEESVAITKESDRDLSADTGTLPVCAPIENLVEINLSSNQETSKKSEIENFDEKIPKKSSKLVEVAKNTETSTSKIPGTLAGKEMILKSAKKKYATLKTIATSVTKIEQGREILRNATETVEKTGEFCYPETSQNLHLPDMLELETPRKFDNSFGIPPTPRLLSPGSNLTTPFGQLGEDISKVRSFVSTPEFPPTPSIALTPKETSQDGIEKKEEFQACTKYYEPSSELKDPRKRNSDHSRHDMSLPLPGMMMAIIAESRVKNISVEVAQGFQASTSSNKLEITQFEVIKENLPREEAFRELKISSCPNESARIVDDLTIQHPREGTSDVAPITSEVDPLQDTKDPNNTSSTMDDSSDSDSSSTSDSSSSSSTLSSSSSSTTNASPNLPITKQSPKRTGNNKIYTDTSNDSIQKPAENPRSTVPEPETEDPQNIPRIDQLNVSTLEASQESNENSPAKVFPIVKSDQELKESATETPAKDESLLSEAVISETPSSSKPGIETTNLNSKISAFITSENREKTNVLAVEQTDAPEKKLPKIISVERILPNVSIAMKPPGVVDSLYNAMQCRHQPSSISDAKLSKLLEEKRHRLLAKFKEKEKPSVYRPRINCAVAIARSKRNTVASEKSVETEKERIVMTEEKEKIVGAEEKERSVGTVETKGDIEKDPTELNSEREIEMTKRSPKEAEERNEATTMRRNVKDEEKEKVEKNFDEEKDNKVRMNKNVVEDKETLTAEKNVVGEREKVTAKRNSNEEKEKVATKRNSDEEKEKVATKRNSDENREKVAKKRNSVEEREKVPTKRNVDEEKEKATAKKNVDEEKDRVSRKETHKKSQKKPKEQTSDKIFESQNEGKRSKDEISSERNEVETARRGEISKKHEKERNDNPTDRSKVTKSRSSHSSDKTRTRNDAEVRVSKTSKLDENLPDSSQRGKNISNSQVPEENSQQSTDCTIKDKRESEEPISSMTVDTKIVKKSKVDLVKRDLFSDEESNDQRTTRSRTRQTSDAQKSDSADSHVISPADAGPFEIKNHSLPCPTEDMPGVLECLDLVPTIKSDSIDEDDFNILDSSQRRHAEYHFIYDESVSTKRRKRKFSNSELEFPVEIELSDDNYRKCPKLMTATIFEEIFNLTPPRKRRRTTKEIESSRHKTTTAESSTVKRAKSAFKGITEKPLATSSPVYKPASSSKISGKTSKSPKKPETQTMDGRKKNNLRNDNGQQEQHEKRNPKTPKRRALLSRESKQVEKKSRSAHPQLLLSNLDLDKFLTTVHGPA